MVLNIITTKLYIADYLTYQAAVFIKANKKPMYTPMMLNGYMEHKLVFV